MTVNKMYYRAKLNGKEEKKKWMKKTTSKMYGLKRVKDGKLGAGLLAVIISKYNAITQANNNGQPHIKLHI